jgi:hypothetical protein
MSNMKEISEIKSQIGTLNAKLRDANERLCAAWLKHHGLSVGDRIMVHDHKKPFEAEISRCNEYGRLLGVKVKSDGSAGLQSAGYIGKWDKL